MTHIDFDQGVRLVVRRRPVWLGRPVRPELLSDATHVLEEQYERATGSKITREKAYSGEATARQLHGHFAPVRVGCPALAERPCRRFVRLTSERAFRTHAGYQAARSS
jgi:hypothetical protein